MHKKRASPSKKVDLGVENPEHYEQFYEFFEGLILQAALKLNPLCNQQMVQQLARIEWSKLSPKKKKVYEQFQ